jgi:hypothetical protein
MRRFYIWIRVMMFNATSKIFQLYRGDQFLLMEETGVPGENHRPVTNHC